MPGKPLYREPMASIKNLQVTFDCADPERLARFWCEVLGYVVPPPPDGFVTWADFQAAQPPEKRDAWFACVDPTGVGPRLYFQRVPEGKAAKTGCTSTYGSEPASRARSASPPWKPNAHG